MGVFTHPLPLCLILDHILLTGHMTWEWPVIHEECWFVERLQSKGAMAEWDFRLVNSFNMYLLRMFSMVGPVAGARDTTMDKEL